MHVDLKDFIEACMIKQIRTAVLLQNNKIVIHNSSHRSSQARCCSKIMIHDAIFPGPVSEDNNL